MFRGVPELSLCVLKAACLLFYTAPRQVIPGSNRLGRIEHLKVAGQTGADMERLDLIKKVCCAITSQ